MMVRNFSHHESLHTYRGAFLKRMRCAITSILVLLLGCGRSPEQNALRTANSLLKENQPQAALDTVQSCLQEHPGSQELLRMRVLILLKQEAFDSAVAALRSLPSSGPALAQALRHRDPSVRSGAARLIAERSIAVDRRDMIRGLEDASPAVRRYCAIAFGKRRDITAIKPLFRLLHDDDWFVRAETAKALGTMGDPRAAGWLVLLLNDPDGFVRFCAARSLREVAGPSNRDLLVAALGRASASQRFDLAVALAKLREPSSLGPLTNALNSVDANQRRRAVQALGDHCPSEATNALARLASDPDPTVREWAAISLLNIVNPPAATNAFP